MTENRLPAWRQYQEEAANVFRQLGLSAETDVRLGGVRDVHDIDVVVRFERSGLSHLWIVECKDHRRPVSKGQVHLLRSIVGDVGADKGILLCEAGFQSGAYRSTSQTNVTTTSLAELRQSAADEIFDLALDDLVDRVKAAMRRIDELSISKRYARGGSSRLPQTPSIWSQGDAIGLLGHLSLLEFGLGQARERRFPAAFDFADDGSRMSSERDHFLECGARALQRFERVVEGLEPAKEV